MRTYLDAGLLAALLTHDARTARAECFVRHHAPVPVVSDLARAKFAAILAGRVRAGTLPRAAAMRGLSDLEAWIARSAETAAATTQDIASAATLLRRLDPDLRVSGALTVALCRRLCLPLATFDPATARCARDHGVALAAA